jgi:transposase-like protein
MRQFKCFDCNHTWEIPYGAGGRGVDQVCPKCKSTNVHRIEKERGRGWRFRGKQDR